ASLPVVPLTGANVGRREELLDGAREQPAAVDPVANRERGTGEGVPLGRERTISSGHRRDYNRHLGNRTAWRANNPRSGSVAATATSGGILPYGHPEPRPTMQASSFCEVGCARHIHS